MGFHSEFPHGQLQTRAILTLYFKNFWAAFDPPPELLALPRKTLEVLRDSLPGGAKIKD
jgi:hypothetical protein